MKNYLYNMFASIKNGQMAKKKMIVCEKKNVCEAFLKVFWDEGFILGYQILNNNNVKIFLKYDNDGKPVINSLKSISKPGKKIYYSIKQIWKLDSSKGLIVFSTSKGLKTLPQCKKFKVGGEPFVIIN